MSDEADALGVPIFGRIEITRPRLETAVQNSATVAA
jgi:hypothetical protein